MKKLNNPEFKIMIQNLLCAEEHTVDMLSTADKDIDGILMSLVNTKALRNELLDFPEEKDRNKWCLVKHLLLAEYHALELINNNTEHKYIGTYKVIKDLLDNAINNEWNVKCKVCKDDLIINRLLKRFGGR